MSHSFNKVWIHAVWATKNRMPYINYRVEQKIHSFLSAQLKELGCPVKIINGMPDHVHCLFLLNVQHSIADTIKQIKGSSAHYINHADLIPEKFAWQTGYASFSVSESAIERVYEYIKNQKTHHLGKSFTQEYEAFLKLYGFNPNESDFENG